MLWSEVLEDKGRIIKVAETFSSQYMNLLAPSEAEALAQVVKFYPKPTRTSYYSNKIQLEIVYNFYVTLSIRDSKERKTDRQTDRKKEKLSNEEKRKESRK